MRMHLQNRRVRPDQIVEGDRAQRIAGVVEESMHCIPATDATHREARSSPRILLAYIIHKRAARGQIPELAGSIVMARGQDPSR